MKKYFTEEGLNKFKKELGYLESDKRKDVAEKIKLAVSQGDLSENAAYDAAKEEQGFVEGTAGLAGMGRAPWPWWSSRRRR